MNSPSATVVITTKNRKVELRQAIQSALEQTAEPEVLIIDDGSTDGTAEIVSTEFARARLDRTEVSQGLVVQRNRAARLASAPIIFSIDDDAAFSSPYVVEQTLTEFDSPRVAAVAIPYVEPKKADCVMQRAPSRRQTWVTDTYIGTAHALRKDVFLRLGGYREALIHQGEERDYCIRMLNAGYLVRLGNADVIKHFESPRREFRRMDFYGRRNDVLFAWHNVPTTYAIPHCLATTGRGISFGLKVGRPVRMLSGLASGYFACLSQWSERHPVNGRVYRLHRRLKKRGPFPLEEIEMELPPMRQSPVDTHVNGST